MVGMTKVVSKKERMRFPRLVALHCQLVEKGAEVSQASFNRFPYVESTNCLVLPEHFCQEDS
jgi:hypothetical protein